MKYKFEQGEELTFRIYGTTVKGEFIKIVEDRVVIKTTQDFIPDSIGEEQSIGIGFLVGHQ